MIPHKLQLKNFLSYGAQLQTVDFSSHRLICLSGKNGHGKSALLDAITWAIWGQARKAGGSGKADTHLLRLGTSHMLVVFEFYFNGTLYKIRREFSKQAGKAIAQLDFALFDTSTNFFKPLTDKTIRDTQELIIHTLGLNFEEFINSAFLRQGQSNEFSKRSAQERKEILSGILGINQYEEIRKKIVEMSRQQTATLAALEHEHTSLQQQTPGYATLRQQMNTLLAEITTTQESLSTTEKIAQELNASAQELHKEQIQYEQLCTEKKQKITLLQNGIHALFKQVTELRAQRKMLRATSATSLQERRQHIQTAIAQLQAQHTLKLNLKEHSLTLRAQLQTYATQKEAQVRQEVVTIELLRTQLKAQEQMVQTQHQQLYSSFLACEQQEKTTKSAVTMVQNSLNDLTNSLKELPFLHAQFEKRKSYFHKWASRAQHLHKEVEQIGQKLGMTQDSTNPCCPLCEQNLSASRKKYLRTKLLAHENSARQPLNRLKKAGIHLKGLLVEQHAVIQNLQKKAEEKAALEQKQEAYFVELATTHTKKNGLQEEINELNKAFLDTQALLVSADEQDKTVRNRLATLLTDDQFYQETTQKLQQLEQELSTYADIAQQLTAQQTTLNQLSTVDEQSLATQQKEAQTKQLEIVHTVRALQKEKKELKKIAEQLKKYAQLPAAQQEIIYKQQILKDEIKKLRETLTTQASERGALEQQILHAHKTEQLLAQKKEQIADLKQTLEDKQILAQAFGKDGIQALLIEEALPEIEQEANALLQQLTDNQAHIIIESLRDLKKGGAKETLDIKISDTLGIRPYELFSGGEAFRIDFALRIALAKLLANRAGTSLQTLIIDEGFGSQDEEGLAHIMDALYKIQDHFSKVIIVSHLPTMKEQFPVHFMVEKSAQGSTIRVLEQG